MVRPITEEQARAALLAAHSEAHDAHYFVAERQSGGWLFRWDSQAVRSGWGRALGWWPTTARSGRCGFRDEAADLLAELNGPVPPRMSLALETILGTGPPSAARSRRAPPRSWARSPSVRFARDSARHHRRTTGSAGSRSPRSRRRATTSRAR